MPTGHMGGNVPKRLMKPDMLDMLEKAGWPMEMLDMLEKAGWPMEIKFFWPGESGLSRGRDALFSRKMEVPLVPGCSTS